ncbi:hypothetical protein CY34DRAFT_805440 [Suillus luteus UH-Slu-Lm8-n1]|uniref:Uncharacterized protein n=1 Tax=Suillus luteus UH-Slu-Lm8-n1 TaxID=930992 RepID=A0A0D0B6D8_9AGAM|nr:hypothetical protein CY34DRAFT_805440 [Suillus luteus UH-Slu-Lm8-n1]
MHCTGNGISHLVGRLARRPGLLSSGTAFALPAKGTYHDACGYSSNTARRSIAALITVVLGEI